MVSYRSKVGKGSSAALFTCSRLDTASKKELTVDSWLDSKNSVAALIALSLSQGKKVEEDRIIGHK